MVRNGIRKTPVPTDTHTYNEKTSGWQDSIQCFLYSNSALTKRRVSVVPAVKNRQVLLEITFFI
jgi:hypothetical protein